MKQGEIYNETRKPRNGNCVPNQPVRNLLLSWTPYKKMDLIIMKPGNQEIKTGRENGFGI